MAGWADATSILEGATTERLPDFISGGQAFRKTRVYLVEYSDSEPTVEDVLSSAPEPGEVFSSHVVKSVSAEEISNTHCRVTVTLEPPYGWHSKRPGGYSGAGWVWEWNFSTASQTVTSVERDATSGDQSQTHYAAPGITPVYQGQGIGVGPDGDVEGAEVSIPTIALKMSREYQTADDLPGGSVSDYESAIVSQLGRVDFTIVSGASAMLMAGGVTRTDYGWYRAELEWSVVYNIGTESVYMWNGSALAAVSIERKGHDVFWATTAQKMVTANVIETVITEGHVARPYRTITNLSGLGL